ncbi:MAG: hypothetical protein FGF53_06085 [Candidatus Brockarchaeota archaeon]|nr:hypothetical protein [Candidatus Brockarchaeota archaeon]
MIGIVITKTLKMLLANLLVVLMLAAMRSFPESIAGLMEDALMVASAAKQAIMIMG